MAERTPLSTCDPEMLTLMCALFQEIWAAHHGSTGAKHSFHEIRELKKAVAARIFHEIELGGFDPARIRERALAGL